MAVNISSSQNTGAAAIKSSYNSDGQIAEFRIETVNGQCLVMNDQTAGIVSPTNVRIVSNGNTAVQGNNITNQAQTYENAAKDKKDVVGDKHTFGNNVNAAQYAATNKVNAARLNTNDGLDMQSGSILPSAITGALTKISSFLTDMLSALTAGQTTNTKYADAIEKPKDTGDLIADTISYAAYSVEYEIALRLGAVEETISLLTKGEDKKTAENVRQNLYDMADYNHKKLGTMTAEEVAVFKDLVKKKSDAEILILGTQSSATITIE